MNLFLPHSNYEFAKFCWKTLVQPQLHSACIDGGGRYIGENVTNWLLDEDPTGRIQSGVIDRLLRHVDQVSKDSQAQEAMQNKQADMLYNISITFALDTNAILRFGSSHTYANPLFEAECFQTNMHASALVSSQTGWFVTETKCEEDILGQEESEEENALYFQSSFSVHYLNTKHDHMECLIEPYPSFGHLSYKTFFQDMEAYGDDPHTSTFVVNIKCPRSLNINALPAFFGACSMVNNVMSQLDPTIYSAWLLQKDIARVYNLWETKDQTKSGFLRKDEAMEVMQLAADMYWKDLLVCLNADEKKSIIKTFCNIDNDDGLVSFHHVKNAIEVNSRRSYFTGCQEIELQNCLGTELRVAELAKSNLYQSVKADETLSISLSHLQSANGSSQSQLCFFLNRYKPIRGVAISPYQSLMLPLVRQRKKSSGSKKRKQSTGSGFR